MYIYKDGVRRFARNFECFLYFKKLTFSLPDLYDFSTLISKYKKIEEENWQVLKFLSRESQAQSEKSAWTDREQRLIDVVSNSLRIKFRMQESHQSRRPIRSKLYQKQK